MKPPSLSVFLLGNFCVWSMTAAYAVSAVLQWFLLGADPIAAILAVFALVIAHRQTDHLMRWKALRSEMDDVAGRSPPNPLIKGLVDIFWLLMFLAGWFVAWNLVGGFCNRDHGEGACGIFPPMIPPDLAFSAEGILAKVRGFAVPGGVPWEFAACAGVFVAGVALRFVMARPRRKPKHHIPGWTGTARVLLPVPKG